jgi:hypothetical protein
LERTSAADVREILPAIDVPTLLVRGCARHALPLVVARTFEREIRGAKLS